MNETPQQKTKKSLFGDFLIKVGLNLLAMAVLLVAILWGVSEWLSGYTRHGESIRIPEVMGQSVDEAVYFLEHAGLRPMVIDSVYADAQPGAVIEMLPEQGLPVKKGRIVYLKINAKSQRMVQMIDVKEVSRRQAISRLGEAGFVVDSVKYDPYEFDDLVLKVQTLDGKDVTPGMSYPYKTHLIIRVSSTSLKYEAQNDSTESDWF